jgi:predicted Fe-Mo cluster-binding NifX family protein
MKIAITATGMDLTSQMDQRLGRAPYFLMVDSKTFDFFALENTQNLHLPKGAGIQAGKTIVDNGAEVVITGNCGPKAFQVLDKAGIDIITGASGRIKDVIESYNKGDLKPSKAPNVEGHWV